LLTRRPPPAALFPYTTLFRSNHLMLLDLTNKNVAGKPAAQALDRAGIVANYNAVPFDPRKPFDPSGLRLGTPAITSRGMGKPEIDRKSTRLNSSHVKISYAVS